MNYIETLQNENLTPSFLVIAYEGSHNSNVKARFEYAPIHNGTVGASQSLNKDTASGIFATLKGDIAPYSFKGIIPQQMIHFNFTSHLEMTWSYDKPKKYLHYKCKELESGIYPIPKLIFSLKGTLLKVYAVHRKETVTDQTKLYQAPFYNISKDGGVCMGTAQLKYNGMKYYETIMEYVEKQFFNSQFTHANTNALLNVNFSEYQKSIVNSKETFNQDHLKDINQPLNHIYAN